MSLLHKILDRIFSDICESAKILFWSALKAIAIVAPAFVLILALALANPVKAQTTSSDETCIECGVIVIVGTLITVAIFDALFGGGSSSSSSDKDCSGHLIPAPEGGLMPADPNC